MGCPGVSCFGGTLGGLVVRTFYPQLDAVAKALQIIGPICGVFLFSLGGRQLNPADLDERQEQVRYDVYLRSFLAIAFVVIILPVLVTIVYFVSEPNARSLIATLLDSLQNPVDFVWTLVALVPLVGFLPWAMLAWLQPDVREDG